MLKNPFKSETSTNQLRGYPVSGRLLTIDFEEYWFERQIEKGVQVKAFPFTIRVLENTELTQVLNVEGEALISLFVDGSDFFEKTWPNGSKEHWTAQRHNGTTRVSGGYGGGAVIAADDEWKVIAKNVYEMLEGG